MSLPPPPPPPAPAAPEIRQAPRCYRHPDREGGRHCTRCGKAACNECLVQAAVGSQCLDCAKASRPDTATRARYWNAGQPILVTKVLIAVNAAVFVWAAIRDPGSLSGRGGISQTQFNLGLNEYFLTGGRNEWYRLITSGFLHFGIIHLAFNMFMLFQLGNLLERPLGRLKFVLLYFASLLAGSFGVLLLSNLTGQGARSITGGASGAVFGLMGAAAIGMHRRGVNIFSTGLGTTLLLNLFITFTIPGISIGGHLGGIVGGLICGSVMLAPHWKPQAEWAGWAAPVAVMVGSVLGSVIIV
jgi:membrane associated rhomboid family serine protease